MDIVEFVEDIFGIQLLEYQKQFLLESYEAEKNGTHYIYELPPRSNGKYALTHLRTVAIVLAHIDKLKNEKEQSK